MRNIPVYFIDTFTSEKFKGNPTAVCLISNSISETEMLLIAKEFNLPVTAFVEMAESNGSLYNIQYFTTLTEIPACGHASLAAAKVVSMLKNRESLQLKPKQGSIIEVSIHNDQIVMSYPKYEVEEFSVTKELAKSLSLEEYISIGFSGELETLFIELPDPEILRNLKPDYRQLIKSTDKIKEVVITSLSDDKQYDYLLRSFCPWIGIDEDPVTGSVHSVLSGFWAKKLNKNNLHAYQASERGGELFIKNFANKVELGGNAFLIMEGSFYF